MATLLKALKKIWTFVTYDIWHVRLSKLDKRRSLLIRNLRVLGLALKGFKEDNCIIKATALTFYSLLSIVPILALIFAISKGFGLEQNLENQILNSYPEYKDILTKSFEYANSMLSNAKGGVIAGFGVLLLLWSVLQLLVSIEDIFNEVWEVNQGRNWIRKVTDYLTVMLISPFLLIVAGGLTVAIQTQIGGMHMMDFISTFLVKLLAYSLVTVVFTFLYMVMPNTKIKFSSAIVAAIVSTILFELVQWVYLEFQIGANRMNAIYGGFAALPLFFIWVQYSWYVVLFGAEVAYAHQYADHYELEDEINTVSQRYKKTIALMICNLVARNFYNGDKAFTAQEISEKLDLPFKLVKIILNELVETGLFSETKSDTGFIAYQPGVTESKFTVRHMFDQLDRKGVNALPINETNEYLVANHTMLAFEKYLDNELGNTFVRNLEAKT
jgi:membrane protein